MNIFICISTSNSSSSSVTSSVILYKLLGLSKLQLLQLANGKNIILHYEALGMVERIHGNSLAYKCSKMLALSLYESLFP